MSRKSAPGPKPISAEVWESFNDKMFGDIQLVEPPIPGDLTEETFDMAMKLSDLYQPQVPETKIPFPHKAQLITYGVIAVLIVGFFIAAVIQGA